LKSINKPHLAKSLTESLGSIFPDAVEGPFVELELPESRTVANIITANKIFFMIIKVSIIK